MLTAALQFLGATWRYWAPALGAVVLLHMTWYAPRIDNLKLRLEVQKQEISRMESVIESQNTAIENASTKSQEAFNTIITDLKKTLDKDRRDTSRMIRDIISSGVPEGCTESAEYLLEQINNLQWSSDNE